MVPLDQCKALSTHSLSPTNPYVPVLHDVPTMYGIIPNPSPQDSHSTKFYSPQAINARSLLCDAAAPSALAAHYTPLRGLEMFYSLLTGSHANALKAKSYSLLAIPLQDSAQYKSQSSFDHPIKALFLSKCPHHFCQCSQHHLKLRMPWLLIFSSFRVLNTVNFISMLLTNTLNNKGHPGL